MDDYDRQNLEFLLNVTPEVLQDWYDQMGEDDHEYASELLAAYKEELDIKSIFIDVENAPIDNISLVPDAVDYLKRFALR